MNERVEIVVDGRAIAVDRGQSVAAALVQSGLSATRRSVGGEARGPLCGMGVCFECRATVDGEAHVKTCMTAVRDGLRVDTCAAPVMPASTTAAQPLDPLDADVAVVGAGPAGLAAALAAASRRRSVVVLDDNDASGGQVWRRDASRPAQEWRERVARAGVRILSRTSALHPLGPRALLAVEGGAPRIVTYRALVLATGATERFVPFPGWTLPNVFGAGGAQALVKAGLDVRGARVVVAGSGPLLLAVAKLWRDHGARVLAIAEQAPASRVLAFAAGLVRKPSKFAQAMRLRASLARVPYLAGWWPTRARGDGRVTNLEITNGTRMRAFDVDFVPCGFGLVPDVRLAAVLGCAIVDGAVAVDALQRTTVDGVFCAGEPTGIGGVDKALAEGDVAGAAAAGDYAYARSRARAVAAERAFARRLDATFALRDELRSLATADTIVCRCEDVTRGSLESCASWRAAKLQARAGMGPCQGRVCGPVAAFLRGYEVADARPPVFNTPLSALTLVPQGLTDGVDSGGSAR